MADSLTTEQSIRPSHGTSRRRGPVPPIDCTLYVFMASFPAKSSSGIRRRLPEALLAYPASRTTMAREAAV